MATDDSTAVYRVGDYLLAIEALAILRGAQRREFDRIARRRAELAGVLAASAAPPLDSPLARAELDLEEGYAVWSATYDPPADVELSPVIHSRVLSCAS